MGKYSLRIGLGLTLLLGGVVTSGAAGLGLVSLDRLTRKGCGSAGRGLVVKAAVNAAEQFMVEHQRCPTGTSELIATRYLGTAQTIDAWGGKVETVCFAGKDGLFAFAVAPGPDRQYGTADDLSSSSE